MVYKSWETFRRRQGHCPAFDRAYEFLRIWVLFESTELMLDAYCSLPSERLSWRTLLPDQISILDIAEGTGFEASLITTFNASLPFYEEIILRRLRANGCRKNVVLMDAAQCSAAWASEGTTTH